MEMAVEEMLKSRSEHAHKYDPLVEAVLVGPDGQLRGTTHRGALRVGDHAEFTLIERHLRDKDLEGSTLYVTLEPCTKREPPKIACANRVVSARIKRVFVGMLDPNPYIQGRGVTQLQQQGVEVDFFDLDLWHQIRTENEGFVEQHERAQEPLPEEEGWEGPSEKEKEAVPAASVDDFSSGVIADYLAARNEKLTIPSAELWAFFHKNGFVTRDEKRRTYVPTVAGLLLFGTRPQDFLVQSKVKAEVQKGEKIKAEDIGGPLLAVPDRVKAFLEEYGPTHTVIREFTRVEEPDYPWDAIREALMNAIVHRDYREGARAFVQVFPGRFVVKSPGLPLKPLSLAKIRAYNAPPYSRNPRLADSFSHRKLTEERGWGLSRMRDRLVGHGLPPPQFSIESGYFVVTFFGQEGMPGKVQIAPELLAKLDERQRKVIDFVRENGRITRTNCVKQLKVSPKTAARALNTLVELGLLEPKGKGPAAHYVLIGS
jgi:ATP-dependent DNA helicase RecG